MGWHVSPFPGAVPDSPILLNVATDSIDVARTAASYAIAESNGRAKVVIFTDSRFAIAEIVLNGKPAQGPPMNISAGDGSPSALLRIKYGSYQQATVPEPLVLHGWQLVDELNRVMNKMPPSNYKVPLKILTIENIESHYNTLNLFDPKNGYREAYRKIWKRK